MSFRVLFVFLLLLAIGFSFQGESELHFTDSHASTAFHVTDLAHSHDDASVPYAPRGEHKDQHGCYHSHAPFVTVKISFGHDFVATRVVTVALASPRSPDSNTILHPPRA
jgi:hypothetical protein